MNLSILRLILPSHLDWLADVTDAIVDLVDEAGDAHREGWTKADDDELIEGIAKVSAMMAHGIRGCIDRVPKPPNGRWIRKVARHAR